MKTTIKRKQATFRLREDVLKGLKIRAQKENRSTNNYLESILLDILYDVPNETTIAAMKEIESGEELETLDLDHFDEFVSSL